MNNACKSKDVPFDEHSIIEKYSCDLELRECMLSLCDECKHYGLTINDVDNGVDSNSDSETNMVRYNHWKKSEDDHLTKMMVEVDADEALGLWQSMKHCKSTFITSEVNLKRFTGLQIVWPWRKFWFTLIIPKTTNQSIGTKPKAHILATNYSDFSPDVPIIKMVNYQSQLPRRRHISQELHRYRASINYYPFTGKTQPINQNCVCCKRCVCLAISITLYF